MATALEEDELIVAAELPLLPKDTVTGFVEFSRRKGDFAIAMALVTYRLESGSIVEPRVAIGGFRRFLPMNSRTFRSPVRAEAFQSTYLAESSAV